MIRSTLYNPKKPNENNLNIIPLLGVKLNLKPTINIFKTFPFQNVTSSVLNSFS